MHACRTALVIALTLLRASAAMAQTSGGEAPAPSFDEVQATIKRMQERLDRLGSTTTERDRALEFLRQQVEQATGEISGSGKTNEALRGEAAVLADRVQDLSADRDKLQGQVGERGEAVGSLETRLSLLTEQLGSATEREAALQSRVAALESAASESGAALVTKFS